MAEASQAALPWRSILTRGSPMTWRTWSITPPMLSPGRMRKLTTARARVGSLFPMRRGHR